MSEEYWEGGTWVYQASITNDAMDAATQTYTIIPGAGSEIELLYGVVLNGEAASARLITVTIDDGTNEVGRLYDTSTNAGQQVGFPTSPSPAAGGTQSAAGARYIVAGTMRLIVTIASVSVSENTALGLVCRIRGVIPTVTEAASAGTPVISINTEQVF